MDLAEKPFEPSTFVFSFLEAFGNKQATIKRLKSGDTNSSRIESGVLQRNNIYIAVCSEGRAAQMLVQLNQSPETRKAKAKFTLAGRWGCFSKRKT